MAGSDRGSIWEKIRAALFTLALTCIVLRAAVWLIAPIAPGIIALALLVFIGSVLFGGSRPRGF